MWDNGSNIWLDKDKFIDMGSLEAEPLDLMLKLWGLERALTVCLRHRQKVGYTSNSQITDVSWLVYCAGRNPETWAKNVRVDYLIPSFPPQEAPEDISFMMTLRNKFVSTVPASLKSSVITLCRSESTGLGVGIWPNS